MKRQKKTYDDDDGRTIADMSGVEKPKPFGDWFPSLNTGPSEKEGDEKKEPIPRETRRAYVLSAVLASLLIAFVFAFFIGLAILLMTLFWK